jgi:hypothetical protein
MSLVETGRVLDKRKKTKHGFVDLKINYKHTLFE